MKNSSNINLVSLLTLQEYASFGYVIASIVAIMLAEHRKKMITNQKTIMNTKEANYINIFNHVGILILTLTFLYVNQITLKNAEDNNENTSLLSLQYDASILNVLAAILVLYVILNSSNNKISNIENPEL